jgi:hypothetical protein
MNSSSSIGARSARPRHFFSYLFVMVAAMLICSQLQASIQLPLPNSKPDIWSHLAGTIKANSNYSYNAGTNTGTFETISGKIFSLDIGSGPVDYAPFSAPFTISNLVITVDPTDNTRGNVVSGNLVVTLLNKTLSPTLPYAVTEDMLLGSITDIRFIGTGVGFLEMAFKIEDGNAADDFGVFGALEIGPITATNLKSNFGISSGGTTINIYGAVPEPTGLAVTGGLILMSALLGSKLCPGLLKQYC